MKKPLLLLTIAAFFFLGCKKEDDETVSFEVTCTGCTITYTDINGSTASASNINSSFKKTYNIPIDVQLTIAVRSTATVVFFRNDKSVYSEAFYSNTSLWYDRKTGVISEGSGGSSSGGSSRCGNHNGNSLYIGPQGGCYYYNRNGNKTYVDRSKCRC
jgi:hypothetical protein